MTSPLNREPEAVRLLALHRFLTHPQLEEFLLSQSKLTPRSRQVVTWRLLGRLQQLGLVAATSRHSGGAVAGSSLPGYFLTRAGLRVAAACYPDLPAHRPARRAPFLLAHSVMSAEVELAFRRSARSHEDQELEVWELDWQIAMKLGSKKVIPDARLEYRRGEKLFRAFVEVDLGTEGTRFFARKVQKYIELYADGAWRSVVPHWPVVLTVTQTDTRARSLCVAAASTLEQNPFSSRGMRFKFCAIETIQGAAGPIAALWRVAGEKELSPLAAEQVSAASSG